MLYSGSLYLALNMEYSIPGCRRVVHGELSLARLEHEKKRSDLGSWRMIATTTPISLSLLAVLFLNTSIFRRE